MIASRGHAEAPKSADAPKTIAGALAGAGTATAATQSSEESAGAGAAASESVAHLEKIFGSAYVQEVQDNSSTQGTDGRKLAWLHPQGIPRARCASGSRLLVMSVMQH